MGKIDYHINPDGSVPCTNACGLNLKRMNHQWVHENGIAKCLIIPHEGQHACPEPRNECGEAPAFVLVPDRYSGDPNDVAWTVTHAESGFQLDSYWDKVEAIAECARVNRCTHDVLDQPEWGSAHEPPFRSDHISIACRECGLQARIKVDTDNLEWSV